MDPCHKDDSHLICQHRIEVDVWPPTAEVCFWDERFAHPYNTAVRFEAHVFNAPTNRVTWEVLNPAGGPGAGAIDAAGLYMAPKKGSLDARFTDLVVATSVDDPSRKAVAKVTVAGLGPLPPPHPHIEVYPRRVHLYYPAGPEAVNGQNLHIDSSNTMQLFRALVRHAPVSDVTWSVDGGPVVVAGTGEEYLYKLTGTGAALTFHLQAALQSDSTVAAHATVSLLNYHWPGIIT